MQETLLIEEQIKPSRPQINDLLWKGVIEDLFKFLITFLNPDALKLFDLDRGIEFLDKEMEQVFPPEEDQYNPKVIDKLVKVYTREGKEAWILLHIEVQAKYSKDFALRMFIYFYRIFDKYKKKIAAYAILTEGTTKVRSNSFNLSYCGTILNYTFNVFKIADQKEEDLLASDNPFALVALIAKGVLAGNKLKKENRDDFLLEVKCKLLRELLSRKMPKEQIRVLMNFLRYYIRFNDPENNHIFEQQVEQLTEKTITMGIEELLLDQERKLGIQQGRKETLAEKNHIVVENLILELGLSDEQTAKIADVSLSFVKKVRKELEAKK